MHVLSQRFGMTGSIVALVVSAALMGASPARGEPAEGISNQSVVTEINRHRLDWGLDPLLADERLDAAAVDRILDMETVGYWGHECPEGHSPFVSLGKHGFLHKAAGENLAAGYETSRLLVESWMESPGHRANILSPDFSHIGVAWIDGGTTHRMSGRSIVVLFAREMELQ